jgi:ABC-2 type transport system permease protein
MSVSGLVAAAYAVQATLKLRSEEESLRTDLVLATSVGRMGWAASHLAFAALGSAIILSAVGMATGLAYGLSASDVAQYLPRGLAAAIVQLPAVWVVASIAVALFGIVPRFAGVTWGILVGFLFLGEVGAMLQLSQWMLDLSPFTHVPKVLIGETAAPPLLGLLAVAIALTTVGLVGLRRRDIGRV